MTVRVPLIFAMLLVIILVAGCSGAAPIPETPTPVRVFEETRNFESAMLTLTALPLPTTIPLFITPSHTPVPTGTPLPTETLTVTPTPTETFTAAITETPTQTNRFKALPQ